MSIRNLQLSKGLFFKSLRESKNNYSFVSLVKQAANFLGLPSIDSCCRNEGDPEDLNITRFDPQTQTFQYYNKDKEWVDIITYVAIISPTAITLELGDNSESVTITLLANGVEVPSSPTFTSSNPSVATVHPTTGLITPVAIGDTVITATEIGKYTKTSAITVVNP